MKAYDLIHELGQTAAVFGRNKEVSLHFEGDGAYTDGKEIVLPAIDSVVEFDHNATMVMRGYLDHEAGHIRHTDFEALEKFARTNTHGCKQIWNCLEDMWLERKVMEEYPGAQKNLTVLSENVGQKELEYQKSGAIQFEKTDYDNVTTSILRMGRKDYGGEANKEMISLMPEKYRAWGDKWVEEAHKCKNSSELMNLAIAIEKMIEQAKESGSKGEPDPAEGDPQEFSFNKDGDITQGKPVPGKDKSEEQIAKEIREGKGSDKAVDLNDWAKEFLQSQTDKFYEDCGSKKPRKYKVLTTRFDEVYDRDSVNARPNGRHDKIKKASVTDYERAKMNLGGLVNTMKARLRRALMAKENRDWDFGREFGRLDTKRLVAGSMGAPQVYKQRQERLEMDTAVHFLVDLSGSMGGEKIRVAADASIAFAECLEGTQIKYQISGFSNDGYTNKLDELYQEAVNNGSTYHRYEPLNLFRYKRFNESLQVAKGAVSAISGCAGGNNSDRDAVLWAYHELASRPERRKILVVLSDGCPANSVIGSVSRDSLVGGLKMAIDEVTKNGVECVGIGICDSTVSTIYPKNVVIHDVKDLSGAVFTQLSNLLTGGKVNF